MKAQRGFTLIELLISAGIMVVAVAAAGSLLVTATAMARNEEMNSDDHDASRNAGATIARAVQEAGLYAPGGIYVNVTGTNVLVNPVFGLDGTSGNGTGSAFAPTPVPSGIDDIWVVSPDMNATREACKDSGAAVIVTTAAPNGTLSVDCGAAIGPGVFLPGDVLMAANTLTGALLSPPHAFGFGTTATIGYAESGQPSFSDAPTGNSTGYHVGDLVFRVNLLHFFIKNDPVSNAPALFSHRGMVGTDGNGRQFKDDPGFPDALVQQYIEDIQFKFGLDFAGTGDPSTYTWQDYLSPDVGVPAPVRSVRINAVARSKFVDDVAQGAANQGLRPLGSLPAVKDKVENHTPVSVVPDGYRRSLYTRRVELRNLVPGNL